MVRRPVPCAYHGQAGLATYVQLGSAVNSGASLYSGLMPFESKAQQRWMFANKPEMAKRWAAVTPNIKNLPARKGKKSLADIYKRP